MHNAASKHRHMPDLHYQGDNEKTITPDRFEAGLKTGSLKSSIVHVGAPRRARAESRTDLAPPPARRGVGLVQWMIRVQRERIQTRHPASTAP